MTRHLNTASTGWRPRGLIALFAVAALLLTQTGVIARLQSALDDPSPASGHASVIAQGVAEMPVNPIAWRVVRDTAEPLEIAQPVERALGFVLAAPDGVHVVDESAEAQARLAPGEASFVAEGSVQRRASLTDADASYFRVALVGEAEAQDPGSDELIFGGEPFDAPSGRRDIDLVRDVLGVDEQSTVAGGDFPVLVIATGGSISIGGGTGVTLTAGEAAQFAGEIDITGLAADSAFVAAVIGPEVPVPPRTTGTITVGIYTCPAGVTPDALGDPLDPAAVEGCSAVADGVPVTLTTPDGNELTLDDTDEVRTGVFSWTALPFGAYVINNPEPLPAGSSSPTIYDSEGIRWVNGDATIDASFPDLHVDLYLFETGTGSITVTVYTCPSGWTPDTLDPSGCDVTTGGVDVTLTSNASGEQLTLADAGFDGSASYTWSNLALSPDAGTLGDGYYQISETVVPGGFNAVTISGTDESGGVNLSPEAPDVAIDIFNWITAEPVATITLDSVVCPSVDSAPEECTREFGPSGITGVFIQDTAGEFAALTEGNALVEGDGPYVWVDVPLGAYYMDASGLVAPDGYQISGVVLTPDGADISAGFVVDEDIFIANIVVLLVPVDGGGPPVSAADTDDDGLSDEAEASAGTDASNPDSDNDCHLDGMEIEQGTDPLDPSSVPAGDCDMVPDSGA